VLLKLNSCRLLQNIWARSHSAFYLQRLRSATNKYHAAIVQAKRSFHASSVSSNITKPRKLWTTVNKILHRKISNSLPTCPDSASLSNSFAYFFSSKIHKIHTNLLSDTSRTSHIPWPRRLILLRNLTSSCLLQLMRYQNFTMNPLTLIVTLILFLTLFLRNVNLLYFQLSLISSIIWYLVFFLINLNFAQFIFCL
jgi:hypothetical protein